uniref:Uncharacterized protein n=1 Tax=Arundo donax TaxID=35708 RepID=A0A0A9DAR9_ARUDO
MLHPSMQVISLHYSLCLASLSMMENSTQHLLKVRLSFLFQVLELT